MSYYDNGCPHMILETDSRQCFIFGRHFNCGGTACIEAKAKERAERDAKRKKEKKERVSTKDNSE